MVRGQGRRRRLALLLARLEDCRDRRGDGRGDLERTSGGRNDARHDGNTLSTPCHRLREVLKKYNRLGPKESRARPRSDGRPSSDRPKKRPKIPATFSQAFSKPTSQWAVCNFGCVRCSSCSGWSRSCSVGYFAAHVRHQRAAAAVRALGGSALYDFQETDLYGEPLEKPPPAWA